MPKDEDFGDFEESAPSVANPPDLPSQNPHPAVNRGPETPAEVANLVDNDDDDEFGDFGAADDSFAPASFAPGAASQRLVAACSTRGTHPAPGSACAQQQAGPRLARHAGRRVRSSRVSCMAAR
jgi:hypothetical protein